MLIPGWLSAPEPRASEMAAARSQRNPHTPGVARFLSSICMGPGGRALSEGGRVHLGGGTEPGPGSGGRDAEAEARTPSGPTRASQHLKRGACGSGAMQGEVSENAPGQVEESRTPCCRETPASVPARRPGSFFPPLSGHRPACMPGELSLCLSVRIGPRGHSWGLWKLPSGRPWGRATQPDLSPVALLLQAATLFLPASSEIVRPM